MKIARIYLRVSTEEQDLNCVLTAIR